ncbi:hypothetical protein M409DRAFT_22979 [Zasmidium cellare ATCC 36951]|uniref:F-box domain-containing protein n=1 Tax=Zasmidium cellare ATCC 36951 TaxID=1080233 RepID=A0A6A6CI27_ZASCE|nr:uncharacterized protein M409DRAFT_22979 [Zasmidium cellare ATCC 36951]KAF2166927.1 hypothetical protein M409DRAFT_22979 [Zasmidium cellare ATCC 36951]
MPPPHLPNEIWLTIITHITNPRNTWLSLRPVNRQTQACVEKYFAETLLPQLKASLPMIMPSYDARNPIRGSATFRYCKAQTQVKGMNEDVVFELDDAGPQFYRENFLGRWKGLRDVDRGWLRESVVWEVGLGERVVSMRMKGVRALREGVEEEEARMRFEWKGTLTAFLR